MRRILTGLPALQSLIVALLTLARDHVTYERHRFARDREAAKAARQTATHIAQHHGSSAALAFRLRTQWQILRAA